MASMCDDFVFTPFVSRDCRSGLDFTLLFENTILYLLPSTLYIVTASIRVWLLCGRQYLLPTGKWQHAKTISVAAWIVLALAVLISDAVQPPPSQRWSFLLPDATAFLSAILTVPLSFLEHRRTRRPSSVLLAFLLLSGIFDIARVRTLWQVENISMALKISSTTCLATKLAILVVEIPEKKTSEQCPEQFSNLVNRSHFFWMNRLFLLGRQRRLALRDLFELDPGLNTLAASTTFDRACKVHTKDPKAQSLVWTLIKVLKWRLLSTAVARLFLLLFTLSMPLALNPLLAYLRSSDEQRDDPRRYAFIIAFACIFFGSAYSTGAYWYSHFRNLSLIRAYLVSAVSRQAGVVDTNSLAEPQATLTLMSADVERVTEGLRMLHEVWANILQVIIAAYLLSREVGIAAILPIALAIICSLTSLWVSHLSNLRQQDWMASLQSRISASSEALLSMKAVKLRGVGDMISRRLQDLRGDEMQQANRFRLLGVWAVMLGFAPELLAPALTFLLFISLPTASQQGFDSVRAFTTISILQILTQPLNTCLQNLPSLVATLGCLKRIQTFLGQREWSDARESRVKELTSVVSEKKAELSLERPFIQLDNVSFGYDSIKPILRNVRLTITPGRLVCIIGGVGSGKSTLCKLMMGQLQPGSGTVRLYDERGWRTGYCSQTPYIWNRSVRDNIVMHTPFEQDWYNTVIQACGLGNDLSGLVHGDSGIAGSNGIKLSGGQKQKIALARAVYARCPLIVCDDIFSALDANSAAHISRSVFDSGGLTDKFGATVVIATHSHKAVRGADHIFQIRTDGTVHEESGTPECFIKDSSHGLGNPMQEGATSDVIDKDEIEQPELAPDLATESSDNAAGEQDFSLYAYYFGTMKTWTVVTLLGLALCVGALYTLPSYWLKVWTEEAADLSDKYRYWGIYTAFLGAALLCLALFEYFSFIHGATQAGLALHVRLIQCMLNATWSCISRTDTGSLLNRLSQDLQLVDAELPLGLQNLVLSVLLTVGQAILVAVAEPYVALAYIPIILIFYLLQLFYLRTSRQLRVLDLEAKAPLFTHFRETIAGSITIRAFGWAEDLFNESLALLDVSQRAAYLLAIAQRWLTFVLDMIVAFMAVIIVTIAVVLDRQAGSTGLALTQIMSTSLLLRAVILAWTRVEICLGAVARTKTFPKHMIAEHDCGDDHAVDRDWPRHGKIEFKNLSAQYTSGSVSYALNNISCVLGAGKTIAICGPSGSGKSSLILAILRMLHIDQGSIEIDGVDVRDVSLSLLRQAVVTIPQEPLWLAGSIRSNLDPRDEFEVVYLEDAIKQVQLWDLVQDLGGLEVPLKEGSLSAGQRQLLTLASALLRKTKVLFLDEIASNVDRTTEALMSSVLAERFAGSTVVSITHRLDHIQAFDLVIYMEGGKIVEFNTPATLLGTSSRFRAMWMKQQR